MGHAAQYLIPLTPVVRATPVPTIGDNNYGDGVAINGVPLAKPDSLDQLAAGNNPAPLDCALAARASTPVVSRRSEFVRLAARLTLCVRA